MSEKKETDPELLHRLGDDGKKWAEEFNLVAQKLGYSEMDEGWLIGWFANAIEYSWILRSKQAAAEIAALRKEAEENWSDYASYQVHHLEMVNSRLYTAIRNVKANCSRELFYGEAMDLRKDILEDLRLDLRGLNDDHMG